MFGNYLKISLRHLVKDRLYTIINVLGLAAGIAVSVLIFLFVHNELTHDTFHDDGERIYRVLGGRVGLRDNVPSLSDYQPIPLAPALLEQIPEIETAVRGMNMDVVLKTDRAAFRETVHCFDPEFFTLFSFPLRDGDPRQVLAEPTSVVLTPAAARKYFGDNDPLGRDITVRIDGADLPFIVTGIAEAPPANSSLQFDIILPYDAIFFTAGYRERRTNWFSSNSITFVRLRPGTDPAALDASFDAVLEPHYGEQIAEMRANGYFKGVDRPIWKELQPLADVHLDTRLDGSMLPVSNPWYSVLLGGIALAVLLIACMNFMNLALARSVQRAREVGIRKVVGAGRLQLIGQFWGEALILSLLALVAGLALAELLLPRFNAMAQQDLSLGVSPALLTFAGIVTLATALVAGGYPALVLARFQPREVLSNRVRFGGGNRFTRVLLLLQFAMTVFLVITTFTMSEQLTFLLTRDLGFDSEQVVVITAEDTDGEVAMARMKTVLAGDPGVVGVTGGGRSFNRGGLHQIGYRDDDGVIRRAYEFRVDHDYLDVMGLELAQGRNFAVGRGVDSSGAVIVNEALLADYGIDPATALGTRLTGLQRDVVRDPQIIGVVRDFHFESLHDAVQPAVLHLDREAAIDFIFVRIRPAGVRETLERIRAAWSGIVPDVPFDYAFLDDDIDGQYRAEQRWRDLLGYGSSFALWIALMGIFGLTALTVARRTKEIGIRKVLGADGFAILRLIATEFTVLIVLANLVAWPLAFLTLRAWLGTFAFHVAPHWGVFLLSGLGVMAVAWATIAAQSLRALWMNPVKALRSE